MKHLITSISLYLILYTQSFSQITLFSQAALADTLPSNKVHCILAASDGKRYLGTSSGVSVYDGKKWQILSRSVPLLYANITAMCERAKDEIWFGTPYGIVVKKGISYSRLNKSNGLQADNILSLATSKNGEVWIGTTKGLVRYTGTQFMYFNKGQWVSVLKETASAEERRGKAGAERATPEYTAELPVSKKGVATWYADSLSVSMDKGNIHCIVTDQAGRAWIGTDYGIVLFNEKKQATRFSIKNDFGFFSIKSLTLAKDKVYAMDHLKRIFYFDGKKWMEPVVSGGFKSSSAPVKIAAGAGTKLWYLSSTKLYWFDPSGSIGALSPEFNEAQDVYLSASYAEVATNSGIVRINLTTAKVDSVAERSTFNSGAYYKHFILNPGKHLIEGSDKLYLLENGKPKIIKKLDARASGSYCITLPSEDGIVLLSERKVCFYQEGKWQSYQYIIAREKEKDTILCDSTLFKAQSVKPDVLADDFTEAEASPDGSLYMIAQRNLFRITGDKAHLENLPEEIITVSKGKMLINKQGDLAILLKNGKMAIRSGADWKIFEMTDSSGVKLKKTQDMLMDEKGAFNITYRPNKYLRFYNGAMQGYTIPVPEGVIEFDRVWIGDTGLYAGIEGDAFWYYQDGKWKKQLLPFQDDPLSIQRDSAGAFWILFREEGLMKLEL